MTDLSVKADAAESMATSLLHRTDGQLHGVRDRLLAALVWAVLALAASIRENAGHGDVRRLPTRKGPR